MIYTVKSFGIINKAEIDVLLEFSCFFNDPTDVGYLISGSSAFSKSSLSIWDFTVHILLKPGLENFEHYFASVWDECNCAALWASFGIAFLWDWNENWPFPVLWLLMSLLLLLLLLSRFSRVWLCATPWTAAYQAPPSMGFSRQKYWSGVPLPSPNELCLCLEICLSSRFKSIVLWPGMTHLALMPSQNACCGWGA